jgi:hypothetical protein
MKNVNVKIVLMLLLLSLLPVTRFYAQSKNDINPGNRDRARIHYIDLNGDGICDNLDKKGMANMKAELRHRNGNGNGNGNGVMRRGGETGFCNGSGNAFGGFNNNGRHGKSPRH